MHIYKCHMSQYDFNSMSKGLNHQTLIQYMVNCYWVVINVSGLLINGHHKNISPGVLRFHLSFSPGPGRSWFVICCWYWFWLIYVLCNICVVSTQLGGSSFSFSKIIILLLFNFGFTILFYANVSVIEAVCSFF